MDNLYVLSVKIPGIRASAGMSRLIIPIFHGNLLYTFGAGAVGICQLIRVQKKNRSHSLEKLLSEGTDLPALH